MFGFIGSIIGGVCSAISSVVSAVGSAIATTATALVKIAGATIDGVISVIKSVGVALGVVTPEDNLEELGDKAMNADKKVEDFEYVSDYIQYLKDEVAFDKANFDKLEDKDKLARKALGATIVTKGIEEKKDVSIPLEFWVEADKQKMTHKEINGVIDTFKDNNISNNFADFCQGKLDYKDEVKTGNLLVETYKQLEPNLSEEQIEAKVMGMEAISKGKGE